LQKNLFMHVFGLLGHPLGHSFSKGYFTEKFSKLGLSATHSYELFDIANIEFFLELLNSQPNLKGLNVTIPYKMAIMPYLQQIDPAAQRIGAVNTIKILPNGMLRGYNTDYWGFKDTLLKWEAFIENKPKKALLLGQGGASKAVAVALQDLGVAVNYVSSSQRPNCYSYGQLSQSILAAHTLLVNCSPLGMYPNADTFPDIPYHLLGPTHLAYDIVYNPLETSFLQKAKAAGVNDVHFGLAMLHGQAEKAWEIWQE
jgi:shikimate dehydrogenase